MRHHALIPAAGSGTRFGSQAPKQYWPLAGKPVLAHAIERLATAFPLATIHVALAPHDAAFDRLIGAQAHVTALRCGGATRAQTVRNALERLTGVADDDWIIVHDAARPCVDADAFARLQRELRDDRVGGLLAIPVVGTVKRADADGRVVRTEPREDLWVAQTPQMFRYAVLREALARPGAEHATDEAQAVEALGAKPRLILGSATNIKITYPEDLALAAAILSGAASAAPRAGAHPTAAR